jgi:APA family basic amino acid/polyamine antiporter
MAAEAKNPHRNLPWAVFGTIITVTVLYCFASFALVGMQPYYQLSTDSCFSLAFQENNMLWASNIVATGEILSLPLVVLVSFLAQPRLQFAMAEDGLLPKVFSEIDSRGNLTKGIILSGALCTFIAVFIPFAYLDDMISAGVLLSFNLTNTALIITRRGTCTTSRSSKNVRHTTSSCEYYMIVYHIVALVLAYNITYITFSGITSNILLLIPLFLLSVAAGYITWRIYIDCPENDDPNKDIEYRVSFVPFTPLFGIFINYILFAQLSFHGVVLIVGYYTLATLFYLVYGIHGNDAPWKRQLCMTNTSYSLITFTDSSLHEKNSDEELPGQGKIVNFTTSLQSSSHAVYNKSSS